MAIGPFGRGVPSSRSVMDCSRPRQQQEDRISRADPPQPGTPRFGREGRVNSISSTPRAGRREPITSRCEPQLSLLRPSATAHLLIDVPIQQFPLHKHGHILGTLNPSIPIPASKHLATILFAQVIPSHRLYTAQKRLHELDEDLSRQGISAVGAWRGAGIHEDGWVAGIRAAEKLGGKMPFPTVPRDREVARMGVVEWLRGLWVGPVRKDAMESKEKLL
jgi:hypothetical protein